MYLESIAFNIPVNMIRRTERERERISKLINEVDFNSKNQYEYNKQ